MVRLAGGLELRISLILREQVHLYNSSETITYIHVLIMLSQVSNYKSQQTRRIAYT